MMTVMTFTIANTKASQGSHGFSSLMKRKQTPSSVITTGETHSYLR